jgi:hypothetical protein
MSLTEQILDQIPGNPLEGLRRVDQIWQKLRSEGIYIPTTINTETEALKNMNGM